MIGFKQIQDMTLEECYNFIQQNDENNAYYDEVKSRFEMLIEGIRKQEEKDFKALATIGDCDAFIKKYSDYAPTYISELIESVQAKRQQLIIEAEQEEKRRQESIRREKERKLKLRKRIALSILCGIVVAAIIVFFIGYKPAKYINVNDIEFGKEGGEKTIRIETNVNRNAIRIDESHENWVNIQRDGKMLTIIVEENPAPERSCTLSLYAYSTFFKTRMGTYIRKDVIIRQKSGYATNIDISRDAFEAGKYGETYHVTIKTDGVQLSLTPSDSWIKYKKTTGSHDSKYYHIDTYDITIEENSQGYRTGKIDVVSGGKSRNIVIKQASGLASKFDVDRTYIGIVKKSGDYYTIGVDTDGVTWDASTNCDWITLSKYSDNKLGISVSNNYGEIKSGYVYLYSNNGHKKSIKIEQDGSPTSFYASYSKWTFDTDSDYEYISFVNNSNMPVTAKTDKSWLAASVYNNNVRISCESNKNPSRNGTVTLCCGDRQTTINIHQKGWTYTDCPSCPRDMWGRPTGKIFVGFGTPWGHWENCSTCGGSGKIKKKDQ